METLRSPICIALDAVDPAENERIAAATEEHAGMFKVGLTSFISGGPELVSRLSARRPVFLDLKLHDIPVQVEGAVRAATATGAAFVTVHASGGRDMMRAAVAAAQQGKTAVLAVTVLTSLDDRDLEEIGLTGPAEKAVLRAAELALDCGVDGLVCSPLEVAAVRERSGPRSGGGPLLVVPGIRASAAADDQRRTLGPIEALDAGADVLVVGRPVTAASDPGRAAADLARTISR